MDWDDLRIFLQLSRAPNMIVAAKALGLDDSTVSRRISRLESNLGIPLVSRAGKRTTLTEKGLELAKTAGELESIVLRKIVGDSVNTGTLAGVVRVGAPEGLGVGYLAEELARISAENTGLETELVALPRSYSLTAREVDIAISLDRPTTGPITAFRLTNYMLAIYGTDKYFRKHGKPRTVTDLPSHIFSGYIPELLFTSELDFLQLIQNVDIRSKVRSTSVLAQLNAVECGAAIGILPTFLSTRRKALKIVLPKEVTLERAYWLSVHDDLKSRPNVKFVINAIRRGVHENRNIFLPRSQAKLRS